MPCHTRMKTLCLQGLLGLCLLKFAFTVANLEPGYLDFDNLPDTNFSCVGKVIGGYYADLETSCQMFHVCTIGQLDEPMDIRFLCLNGTVFDQETRVCERIDEVDCTKSEQFYSLNLELYGNTQPPLLEESPETEPPIVIKPVSSTTTSTTTTTQQPTKQKSTRPSFYTTPKLPTITTAKAPTPKVISNHHFPVGHSADIRFNPAEINISLHPGQAPIIRPKSYSHQQTFNDHSDKNKRVIVTTHTSPNKKSIVNNHEHEHSLESPKIVQHEQVNLSTEKILQHTTINPKPVVSYGSSTPSEYSYSYEDDSDIEYHTKIPNHPSSYQFDRVPNYRDSSSEAAADFESNKNENVFKSSTFRTIFHSTTKSPNVHHHSTTFKNVPFSSSFKPPQQYLYHRSEKPAPARIQLPLPLLPTIPPLTFSSPAPFTLNRHVETKRFADHSAPRIVISASASVSDASGRRLNYSLGTIETSEFFNPTSYEDYKEDEIGLEHFYADVPKIQKARQKRKARKQRRKRDVRPEDIIKSEQEAIDILKFLYDWYEQHEKSKTSTKSDVETKPENIPESSTSIVTDINEHTTKITIPVSPQVITDINNELAGSKAEYSTEDIFKEYNKEDKPVNWQSTKKYVLQELEGINKEKKVNEAVPKSDENQEQDDLKRASTFEVETIYNNENFDKTNYPREKGKSVRGKSRKEYEHTEKNYYTNIDVVSSVEEATRRRSSRRRGGRRKKPHSTTTSTTTTATTTTTEESKIISDEVLKSEYQYEVNNNNKESSTSLSLNKEESQNIPKIAPTVNGFYITKKSEKTEDNQFNKFAVTEPTLEISKIEAQELSTTIQNVNLDIDNVENVKYTSETILTTEEDITRQDLTTAIPTTQSTSLAYKTTVNTLDYVDDNYEGLANNNNNNLENSKNSKKENKTINVFDYVDDNFEPLVYQTEESNSTDSVVDNSTNSKEEVNEKEGNHKNTYIIAIVSETDKIQETTTIPLTTIQEPIVTNTEEQVKHTSTAAAATTEFITENVNSSKLNTHLLETTTPEIVSSSKLNTHLLETTTPEIVSSSTRSTKTKHSRRKHKQLSHSKNSNNNNNNENKRSNKGRSRGRGRAKFTVPDSVTSHHVTEVNKQEATSFTEENVLKYVVNDLLLNTQENEGHNNYNINSTTILNSEITDKEASTVNKQKENIHETLKEENLPTTFRDELTTTVENHLITTGVDNLSTTEKYVHFTTEEINNLNKQSTIYAEKLETTTPQIVTTEKELLTTEKELLTTGKQLLTTEKELLTTEKELPTTEKVLLAIEKELLTTEKELLTTTEIPITTTIPLKMESLESFIENIEISTKSVVALKVASDTTVKLPDLGSTTLEYTTENVITTTESSSSNDVINQKYTTLESAAFPSTTSKLTTTTIVDTTTEEQNTALPHNTNVEISNNTQIDEKQEVLNKTQINEINVNLSGKPENETSNTFERINSYLENAQQYLQNIFGETTTTASSRDVKSRNRNKSRSRGGHHFNYNNNNNLKERRRKPNIQFETQTATTLLAETKQPQIKTTTILENMKENTNNESIQKLTEQISNITNSSITEINNTVQTITSLKVDESDAIPLTDSPISKSANPTVAKLKSKVHTTTPISRLIKIKLRKEVVNKNYIFNCFDKPLNHYYSDPRDCRLFHYCTHGYTKNQLLDMKFVCDFGTFFDDEKFVCTKVKPTRCR